MLICLSRHPGEFGGMGNSAWWVDRSWSELCDWITEMESVLQPRWLPIKTSVTARKMYQREFETKYTSKVHFTSHAAMWNICFLWVWVCFPLCPCSLLEFLTSVSRTALVLGLCLYLGIFSCFLWLPAGSVWFCVLDQVGWSCSAGYMRDARSPDSNCLPQSCSLGSSPHLLLLHSLLDPMFKKWMWTHFFCFSCSTGMYTTPLPRPCCTQHILGLW